MACSGLPANAVVAEVTQDLEADHATSRLKRPQASLLKLFVAIMVANIEHDGPNQSAPDGRNAKSYASFITTGQAYGRPVGSRVKSTSDMNGALHICGGIRQV